MFGVGVLEISVVLVLALLVIGPDRLPEAARYLGKIVGYFKSIINDLRAQAGFDLSSHMHESVDDNAIFHSEDDKGKPHDG